MRILQFYFSICFLFILVFEPLAAQEKYEAPKLSNPDSWTMIMVPDTQTYMKFERKTKEF